MRSRFIRLFIFLIVAVFMLPDVADARRSRRGSSYSSGMARPVVSDTGRVTGVIRKRRSLTRTEYDYNWAARRE